MIGYGYSYFVSTILDTESGTPPVNTVAPVISGSNSLGSVLTSTTGTWTGTAPITYAYQWKRNGNNINLATNSTYTITLFDSGADITCTVTATNPLGSNSATSNTITAQTFSAPVNTVAPVISGTQVVGSSLSCTTGTWTGTPTITYAYQWYRGATLISGATSSSYTLVQADAGNTSNITCQVTASNGIGTATATSNTLAQIFDFDADAFITAASITDPTQQSAINQLVVDLKGYSIWTKMKALYPFVGGTASTHKFNLKDPRDLDAAFRLVFSGGWTHSATGATPNGTNAYADTKFNLTKFSSYTNASTGVYLRTNISQTTVDFGQGYANFGREGVLLYPRYSSNQFGGCCIGDTFSPGTNSDSRGLFAVTRTGTTQNVRKRGTSTIDLTTTNNTNSTYANANIFLAASNELGISIQSYSSREQAFAFMGDYLTSIEIDNLYTAVQTFNTTLARQV